MLALHANGRRCSDAAALITSLAGAMPPCRLMVVDDDEWMRLYLASILRSASYEVEVADSGKDALRLLRSGYYDILLTDCQMPDMDGLTLCQQVRVEFPDSSPYILMFTVKGSREDRCARLRSGVNEYITKGASKSELLEKLDMGRRIRLIPLALAHDDVPSRRLRRVDPLMNVQNSRNLARQIVKEIQRTQCGQQAPGSL
jgi:DNA-binding response OmpR family regulator